MRVERDIQAAILAAFAGDTRLRLWRANSGAARAFDGSRFVRFGVPGQADLSGILADGRRIELEVKTATGRQSSQQLAFESMIRKFGGIYILARCTDDALRGIHDADRTHCAACGTKANSLGV